MESIVVIIGDPKNFMLTGEGEVGRGGGEKLWKKRGGEQHVKLTHISRVQQEAVVVHRLHVDRQSGIERIDGMGSGEDSVE